MECIDKVKCCSRMLTLVPGRRTDVSPPCRPLQAEHRLAAGKRNDERAPRAAGSLRPNRARVRQRFFSRRKLLHWYKYNQPVSTVSSAEKHDVIRVWSPSGLLFFIRARGLAAARNLASDAFSRAPATLMRHEQPGSSVGFRKHDTRHIGTIPASRPKTIFVQILFRHNSLHGQAGCHSG